VRQHGTIEQRLEAARLFLRLEGNPFDESNLVVDTMNNSFNEAYASWPFRFWVLSRERILFKAMPQNARYSLQDLDDFLTDLEKM